jgi:DNA-binding response OmpR family regulator
MAVADVLVVDDDPDLRVMLDLHLRSQGHEVRLAATAEEALLASAERRADVLLLDVRLEGRRGDELIRMLDRGLGRPRVLCLLSGVSETELIDLAAIHGVAHLRKPVDPDALSRLLWAAERPNMPAR